MAIYFDRKRQVFEGLDAKCLDDLHKSYPNLDVAAELNKMIIWLNSTKGQGRKGTFSFILNWLNKACPIRVLSKDPFRPYLDEYLKELWKGAEHILEMNTKK